jgi:hypothetical protein
MGAHVYEVGLFKPRQPGDTSTEPEMLPRTWDRETLLRSVSWLRYQNAQGRNIYIRPYGEHHLSLVDDLTAEAIKQMKSEGFAPAVVVEASPENFQAWLNHGEVLPKELSTLAARTLAERFGGDKSAADWRHFGRLAGLTNRKAKYKDQAGRFPFVRVWESSGDPYSARTHFLPDVIGALACQELSRAVPAIATLTPTALRTIDEFRRNPIYCGDGHRIDLAFAIYALSHGAREDDVRTAIASRDLSKKGTESRQTGYIDRTVRKAISCLDR